MIPAVLLVWIIVGYKIYIKYVGEDSEIELVQDVVENNRTKMASEVFYLMGNYRDPFLGNKVAEAELKVQEALSMQRPDKIIQPPVVVPKAQVRWPNINVGGKVNHKALIVIGNKKCILSEGQEELGVKLLKLAKDSVKLGYSGEERSFVLPK